MARRSLLPALAVASAAFALYCATLLPGFDFGDTGSFQTLVGSSLITPRDGYPLYFAIGGLFLRLTHADPHQCLKRARVAEVEAGEQGCAIQGERRGRDGDCGKQAAASHAQQPISARRVWRR